VQIAPPAIPIAGSPAQVGPLPQHLEQIAAARLRGTRIRRAAMMASISGWSMAIFGGITLLSGLFDPAALLLGAGLSLAACLELRGARELRRLDVTAPKRLARNQILLGSMIVGYAAFQLYRALTGPGLISSQSSDPQVGQMLGSFDDVARSITMIFYGAIMLVGIVVPALTAFYYASRRKYVEDFVEKAAPWIVELNRRGIAV